MSEGQEGGVEKDYNNRNLQENMKIIWIDGTFGIGKSAVAAAIVEEIPQAHLLEFDALQEKYKPTSVSDYFGKRYPEAKKYLVDALVDEITEIIQEGSCDCLVIPVALVLPQLSVIIVISHVPQLCFKQLPATSSIHCTFYHF